MAEVTYEDIERFGIPVWDRAQGCVLASSSSMSSSSTHSSSSSVSRPGSPGSPLPEQETSSGGELGSVESSPGETKEQEVEELLSTQGSETAIAMPVPDACCEATAARLLPAHRLNIPEGMQLVDDILQHYNLSLHGPKAISAAVFNQGQAGVVLYPLDPQQVAQQEGGAGAQGSEAAGSDAVPAHPPSFNTLAAFVPAGLFASDEESDSSGEQDRQGQMSGAVIEVAEA